MWDAPFLHLPYLEIGKLAIEAARSVVTVTYHTVMVSVLETGPIYRAVIRRIDCRSHRLVSAPLCRHGFGVFSFYGDTREVACYPCLAGRGVSSTGVLTARSGLSELPRVEPKHKMVPCPIAWIDHHIICAPLGFMHAACGRRQRWLVIIGIKIKFWARPGVIEESSHITETCVAIVAKVE